MQVQQSHQFNIQRFKEQQKAKLDRFQQKHAGKLLPQIYGYQSSLLEKNINIQQQFFSKDEYKKLENENQQLQLFLNNKFQEYDKKITIMSDLIKQLEVQIHLKDDKIKQLEQEVDSRDDKIKQLYRSIDVVVHQHIGNWEDYCTKMEIKTRNLKYKKKDYKKRFLDLQEQCQLTQMRFHILQFRLRYNNVLPLRLRDYQDQINDVNNLNYGQLLQLEELILIVENSIAREDIKKIQKIEIQPNDKFEDVCPICQCNFEIGNKYRKLGCQHYYHAKCIKIWLLENNKCPVCKQIVIIDI